MVEGNFFRLDEEKSKLNKGIIIFRYLPIRNKITHQNPVYMTMNQHFISFNYHSYDNNKKYHRNIELFRLPLSANLNVKDNLTAILKKSYYGVSELDEDDEYIHGALDYKDDYKSIAYWNLDAFGTLENIRDKKAENFDVRRHIIFRKVILDFLFDLEHQKVFRNSPIYDEVEVRLKENFFFYAIAAKASYYYYRALYNYDEYIYKDMDIHSSYDLVVKKMSEAEEQWLSVIRDNKSIMLFHSSNGWFKDAEKEYEIVFFKGSDNFNHTKWENEFIKLNQDKEIDYINTIKESAIWFLKRYNFISAVRIMINYKRKYYWLFYVILFLFVILIPYFMTHYVISDPQKILSTFKYKTFYPENIDITYKYIIFFTYSMIGIVASFIVLSLLFWKQILVILHLIMPRMLMAILSAWFLFATTEELVKVSFDIDLFKKSHILILLLIPVFAFMILELRKIAPDISKIKMFGRVTLIIVIAFIYSVIAGLFSVNYLMKNILVRSGYLMVFYKNLLENDEITYDRQYLINLTHDDSLKKYLDKSFSQLKKKNKKTFFKNTKSGREFFKNINIFVFGVKDSDKSNKKYKKNINNKLFDYLALVKVDLNRNQKILYKVPFLGSPILVFFHMILYRSVFALFLGIFIELIFEEKPVTEPI